METLATTGRSLCNPTSFHDKPLKTRQDLFQSLIRQYEDRIPIIVEKSPKSNLPIINKRNYLVPNSMTVTSFQKIIKERLKLDSSKSLHLAVGKKQLSCGDMKMAVLYNTEKDPSDGFLYITYSEENVYG